MNNESLKNWLLENGGPAVYLNIQEYIEDKYVNQMLAIDKVAKILNYLDGFKIELRDKKTLEHLIHYYKESAIENFFPLLTDYGFKAGMAAMDDKIHFLRDIFNYMNHIEYPHHFYYKFMIHQYFFMAGYNFPEVLESLIQRINKLYNCAKDMNFDIYHDNVGLPKIPKAFSDRKIVKFEMNPFSITAEKPLPTIYDVRAMAYLPESVLTKDLKEKINVILQYILHPEFQKLPVGYGIVWSEYAKRYHACGWSPTLPYFKNFSTPNNYSAGNFLYYLDAMSRFDLVRQSNWFKDSLHHLEQFKTDRETYVFPKEYFRYKFSDVAFLSDENMKLKATERRALLLELISSMKFYQYCDIL